MPNTCAQTVQTVRIAGGIICGSSSTVSAITLLRRTVACAHQLLVHSFVPVYPLSLSTVKTSNFYLLYASYPHNPQSLLLTPPKKIKER
jgi:hypothetical protein